MLQTGKIPQNQLEQTDVHMLPEQPCVVLARVNHHLLLPAVIMLHTTSGIYSSPQDPQLLPQNLDRQQEHVLVPAVTIENTAHSLDTCARCLHVCAYR